ncbi:uncharacterized protein LOC129806060 [Phlebotomus papatasi]|uniref:uncharacterized protein LOC129806060 n=1 Tax=Phlebotomus papatasi TaxID=29031 RepID=UPI002483F611|nr:uncharacterized protein LOC129806060 [Phlebotomus papatasi]
MRHDYVKNANWRPPTTVGESIRECNHWVTQSKIKLRDYIYSIVNEGYDLIRNIETNLRWQAEIYEFHSRNGVMFSQMNDLLDIALYSTAPYNKRVRTGGRKSYNKRHQTGNRGYNYF